MKQIKTIFFIMIIGNNKTLRNETLSFFKYMIYEKLDILKYEQFFS